MFHYAVLANNPQLLFTLLTEGALEWDMINAKDEDGFTAVHYACLLGDADCLSMLLSCGEVDASIKEKNGRHALTLCAVRGFDDLCSMLLNAKG